MHDSNLVLYSFWRSTAAYRVRVALRLKQIAFDERFIDLDAGAQHEAEFLEINPMGAVPALVTGDGQTLTESLAIVEYLDEIEPSPALLPADASGRARVRAIAETMASDTHPLIVPRIAAYLRKHADFDDAAWRGWQTHWYTTGLQGLEKRLAREDETGAFCHGDTVTVADIFVTGIVAIMRVFDIRVADIPTIDAIVARCESQPAFAQSSPFEQPGAPQRD